MTIFKPQALIVPSAKEVAICLENDKKFFEEDEEDNTELQQKPPTLEESK